MQSIRRKSSSCDHPPHHPRARRLVLSLLLQAVTSVPLLGGTNGIVEGVIRDKRTHEAISEVHVAVLEIQSGTSSDSTGRFTLQNIRTGKYSLRFSHIGYISQIIKDVTVNPDLRTWITVELEPSAVEMEEVVVEQEKPLFERDVTGTTYLVSGEEIRLLPVDYANEVLGLKAGVTLEGNVRGGKATEVTYLVDGLPVQDVILGGLSASLPTSSIVGMSIYTGGFEPEYGNALSGVVNMVTRTGGNTHRLFVRADKDDLFGITQTSKTSEFELSATGPIAENRLFYLVAVNGLITDTRWWQDFQHFFSSPIEKNLNAFAKLDYVLSPPLKIGGQVLISHRDTHEYEFDWRYDLGGLPPEQKTSYRIAAILTHTVSENFFYTASLSRYILDSRIGQGAKQDVPASDPWQYDFYLQYIISGQRAWWLKSTQQTSTAKVDGTLKLARANMLKMGGEFNYYDLQSDLLKVEPQTTYFGKTLANLPMLDFSSSYSYHPWAGALYIQDKIDLPEEGALLNFGLRYDMLNPRARRPAIESIPASDTAFSTAGLPMVPASVKQQLSPRLGAGMQVAEHGYLIVNLGWYFQYPLFDYLYTGLDRVALAKGVSAVTGNPDLDPERSQSLEISFKYVLPAGLVASLTYFKKETTNQVDTKTFIAGPSRIGGNLGYVEFVNNPYAEASGFELVLGREVGRLLTGEFSYTYMVAAGTSGSAYQGFLNAQYGLPTPIGTYPLSWDQHHTLKLISTFSIPEQLDVNLVLQWHSGRPYTNYPIANPYAAVDSSLFSPNNGRMPSYFNIDLKAQKHFGASWWPGAVLTLYADVRNLTDAHNVAWMDSNGRIGGELNDPSGYFIGRRTHVGLQLSL